MKVVILCGGQGTRLKEETEFRPKPMVPIGGRPILWHIMKHYANYGFKEFVLCLGFRGDVIKDYFLNYKVMNSDITVSLGNENSVTVHDAHDEDWQVTLAETGASTSTGGRVHRIARHIDGDEFMMTYGDGLSNIDIRALVDFHSRTGRIATVTGLHPESRFGVLDIDAQSNVVRFQEKPQLDGLISGGFFVFDRRVFEYLDEDCVLEEAPMRRLAEDNEMAVYEHDGFWRSMDTYRDFQEFNRMWDEGNRAWVLEPGA